MQKIIINDKEAELIANFVDTQTKRLQVFCKKNKSQLGKEINQESNILMISILSVVGTLKYLEYIYDPKNTNEFFSSVLTQSLHYALKK